MKIINLGQFLEFPANTLFSKYSRGKFGPMCIKHESCKVCDFWYTRIADAIDSQDCWEFFDILDRVHKYGHSINFDFNCKTRDGCFDDDQLFAVWDLTDLENFAVCISSCIDAIKKPNCT